MSRTKTIGFKRTLIRGPFIRSVARVHEIVHELHATKGWRYVSTRKGTTTNRRVPPIEVTFKRTLGPSRARLQVRP